MSEFLLPAAAVEAAKKAYCGAGRTPDQKLEDAIRAFLVAAEPNHNITDPHAVSPVASITDTRPLIDYHSDPAEFARHLEKMAQDYKNFFWSMSIASASRMIRRLLAGYAPPALPAPDIVANHMRMSLGAVRSVYEGIREVVAAGGVAPAQKEAEERKEAVQRADGSKILPRRGVAAASPVSPPISRRPVSATKNPGAPSGFFGD